MKLMQKYLLILFNLIIVASLCFAGQNSVSAQSQAQVTISPPLFPNLTWANLGNVQKDVHVYNQTLILSGDMFESIGNTITESIFNYYSTENLLSLGWSSVGGSGLESTYWHASERYLTVRIGKCTNSGASFCVNVWQSVDAGATPPHAAPATPLALPVQASSFPDPLPVPTFNQRNYSATLGHGTNCPTIATDGCWLTSYAMVYNYYQPSYTNPNSLNTAINAANLYVYNGQGCYDLMPWQPPVAPSGVLYNANYQCANCAITYKTTIDNELANGRPVLAYDGYIGHMVVITGHKNNDFQINDPWDGSSNKTLATGALGSYKPTLILLWNGPVTPPPPPTFHKTSPINGATIPLPSSTLYLLQWENNGSDLFEYCIDESNNNQCNLPNWIKRKSYSGPNEFTLVAGHTYYWQVRRVDNGLEADNGVWWSFTVQLDSPPTVTSITRANPSPTNAPSVSWYVVFSQSVTGVDASDFGWATTGISGTSMGGVTGSGNLYTVTLNTGTGSGTIGLNLLDNDSIINSSGVPLGGVGGGNGNFTGETYIIDKAAPTVVSSVPPVTATTVSINFTVTFSEFVTGVDNPNDFSLTTSGNVTGASITSVSGPAPNNIYTVQVNTGNIGSGTIRLNVVNNGSIKDLALNTLNGGFTGGVPYNKPTFADIPVTHWAWQSIESLYNAGITSGCGDNINYCPETNVSRAQMAVFLLRGKYGASYTPPPATGTVFADVPANAFAAAWIEQLVTEGITNGCGGGNYCPNTTVSRATMAVLLLRGKHGASYAPPPATGTVYLDVPANAFAAAWIEQLAREGISNGCSISNSYCPNNSVTRAQMAIFLVKTFNLP